MCVRNEGRTASFAWLMVSLEFVGRLSQGKEDLRSFACSCVTFGRRPGGGLVEVLGKGLVGRTISWFDSQLSVAGAGSGVLVKGCLLLL